MYEVFSTDEELDKKLEAAMKEAQAEADRELLEDARLYHEQYDNKIAEPILNFGINIHSDLDELELELQPEAVIKLEHLAEVMHELETIAEEEVVRNNEPNLYIATNVIINIDIDEVEQLTEAANKLEQLTEVVAELRNIVKG